MLNADRISLYLSHVPDHNRAFPNNTECPLIPAEGAAPQQIDSASPIMLIGDKFKAQLTRSVGNNLCMTFHQILRHISSPSPHAAGVVDLLLKSSIKYNSVVIVYKFVSAIFHEAAAIQVKTEEDLQESSAYV